MSKIKKHPVLEVPVRDKVIFKYNGQEVEGEKGYTIAAALHRGSPTEWRRSLRALREAPPIPTS